MTAKDEAGNQVAILQQMVDQYNGPVHDALANYLWITVAALNAQKDLNAAQIGPGNMGVGPDGVPNSIRAPAPSRSPIKARAGGGDLAAGDWSWVGERGPELVKFGANAHVYNAQDSAHMGGSTLVQNNHFYGPTDPDAASEAAYRRLRRHQMLTAA